MNEIGTDGEGNENDGAEVVEQVEDEETFAGVRVLSPIADNAGKMIREEEERSNVVGVVSSNTTTIRSKRGTVRGVRNRVRQGIATFLRDPSKKVCLL